MIQKYSLLEIKINNTTHILFCKKYIKRQKTPDFDHFWPFFDHSCKTLAFFVEIGYDLDVAIKDDFFGKEEKP